MADDWGTTVAPELLVGNLADGYVDTSSNIPTELRTFYQTNYGFTPIQAVIRFVVGARPNIYYYYFVAGNDGLGHNVMAQGWVDNTLTVLELSATFAQPGNLLQQYGHVTRDNITFGNPAIPNSCLVVVTFGGQLNIDGLMLVNASGQLNVDGHILVNNGTVDISTTAALNFDGISAPRTFPAVNNNGSAMDILSVGSAVPVGAAELSILSVPSITYRAGRAYEIEYMLNAQATVAGGRPVFHVRQTNPTGNLLGGGNEIPVAAVNRPALAFGKVLFCNASSVDIKDFVILTLADAGGVGGNVQALRPTGSVGYFGPPKDIGAAANFVNPTGLVQIPTLI